MSQSSLSSSSSSSSSSLSSSRLVAVVAACALLGPGCAFAFTEPLADGHPPALTPRCSGSSAPVIVDSVLAGVFALTATVILLGNSEFDDDGRNVIGAIYGGQAAAYLGSALYYRGEAGRCQQARRDHDGWLVEHGGRAAAPAAGLSLPTAPEQVEAQR